MIVYLVRHGRSIANDAGLVTGTPADPLTAAGEQQAERLGAWLSTQGVVADRYFVSQWQRAQQTAQRILPAAQWQVDERIGETHAGDVADWPLAEFVASQPGFYEDAQHAYPGGESHLDLDARVLDWWREVRELPCDRVMVVAHSGPITCVLQEVLGIGMGRFPAFLPANASVSVVEVNRSADGGSDRLLGFSMGPSENLATALRGVTSRAEAR
ncbi:histidine phosphatase family protein [Paraburkholderia tropica]|uniref:histidine phosphatase family protein n=1 Tax=Paraburkholderia tropica TaxID=92647 RepID=UPI002AB7DB4B|nr:histidine phosphatase family protein [Paraburkholderia tropica]